MTRAETTFIAAVLVFAVVFSALSLSHTPHPLTASQGAARPAEGAAGKPRDLDVGKIQRLIREQHLSDHEALYYKNRPVLPESSEDP